MILNLLYNNELWLKPKSTFFINPRLKSGVRRKINNRALALRLKFKQVLKKSFIYIILLFISASSNAQELQGKVAVLAQQVGSSVDKSVFTTLQNQLTDFINKRKWTNDVFQSQEKIRCNFILTIQSVDENNICKASLAIQAARPVYNASYQTALINYQDADVTFKYVQFQQIEFNENRIQGT